MFKFQLFIDASSSPNFGLNIIIIIIVVLGCFCFFSLLVFLCGCTCTLTYIKQTRNSATCAVNAYNRSSSEVNIEESIIRTDLNVAYGEVQTNNVLRSANVALEAAGTSNTVYETIDLSANISSACFAVEESNLITRVYENPDEVVEEQIMNTTENIAYGTVL